ncbi:hypothetical protein FHY55_16130 [Oceanicola sp. D3]|uniref:hypothetical protein n=1 Tax=Oceanicola sp. D3 TaxID=2587163 RepID=UPI001122C6B4|nr:hypothetical protein [Oceanicola sp. D3]QDC10666.1 hypothetical protein FHY55_16130 [Oceanicola sp. D3]
MGPVGPGGYLEAKRCTPPRQARGAAAVPLSKTILLLRLLVALTLPDEAYAEPPGLAASRLQSAAGDIVVMSEAARPDCTSAPCPPRICLENPASNHGPKGLSNRRTPPPDLLVAPGSSACLLLAAVRQTLVLWRQGEGRQMVPALLAPLDLRNKAGHIIFLTWTAEAPRPENAPQTGPQQPPHRPVPAPKEP